VTDAAQAAPRYTKPLRSWLSVALSGSFCAPHIQPRGAPPLRPPLARKAPTLPARTANSQAFSTFRLPSGPTTESLTIQEVIAELKVSRSTFYYWRQTGKAPRCIKLPNGDIRVRRTDLDAWLSTLEDAA
jgi:predicted DNA-binding transcriptional regulator AlpA